MKSQYPSFLFLNGRTHARMLARTNIQCETNMLPTFSKLKVKNEYTYPKMYICSVAAARSNYT